MRSRYTCPFSIPNAGDVSSVVDSVDAVARRHAPALLGMGQGTTVRIGEPMAAYPPKLPRLLALAANTLAPSALVASRSKKLAVARFGAASRPWATRSSKRNAPAGESTTTGE